MVNKSGARWFWAVVMLIELNKQLKEWCYVDDNFLGNEVTGRVVLDDKFLGNKATGGIAIDDKISGAINFLWRAPREHNKAVIINIITQPGTMTTTS